MTTQIRDSVVFQGSRFYVLDSRGSPLFNLEQIGIRTAKMSTACVRGYYCTYEVREDQLVLTELTFSTYLDQERLFLSGDGPKFFGKVPKKKEVRPGWHVSGLSEPVAFSGSLLLGRDFIQEIGTNGDAHSPYRCQHLIAATFHEGRMTDLQDPSDEAAEYRRRYLSPED